MGLRAALSRPSLIFVYICLFAVPVRFADAHQKHRSSSSPSTTTVNSGINDTDGFQCTNASGAIFGSKAKSSCAAWWPACNKRNSVDGVAIPDRCKEPDFSVVYYPVPGAPPYRERDEGEAMEETAKGPDTSSLSLDTHSTNGMAAVEVKVTPPAASNPIGPPPASPIQPTNAAELPSWYSSSMKNNSDHSQPKANSLTIAHSDKELPTNSVFFAGAINQDSSPKGAATETTREDENKENYTDPWLDYVAKESREELVLKLSKDAKLRRNLHDRLHDALSSDMNSGTTSSSKKEKAHYFESALKEAEEKLRSGWLEQIAPLETHEAFAMNGDESDREIKRLLASLNAQAEEDTYHYSLFPRVHRALWRQLSEGNLVLRVPKKNH